MKQILQVLPLLFITVLAFSQANDLEDYYPENMLFKKLKVRSVLDTIESPALHHMKKEFDTAGRQTSWFYVEDSVVTRFRYERSGDTLIKYHYSTTNGIEDDTYQYEIFVYNKPGAITTYKSCQNSYDHENTSACKMDKFFYDEKGRLIAKLIYTNDKYKQPFSKNLKPADSLLTLENVYSYQYDPKGKLRSIKQMMGRSDFRTIDSFYYDKTGRVIKKVSRQKRGYLGEFAVNNLCYIKTYQYAKNRRIETSWATYSDWSPANTIATYKEVNEYEYYPNGLEWMWFYGRAGSPLSKLSYLVYELYPSR